MTPHENSPDPTASRNAPIQTTTGDASSIRRDRLELFSDQARGPQHVVTPAWHPFTVPIPQLRQWESLGLRHRMGLGGVMVGTLAVLLHRYSGQTELPLGLAALSKAGVLLGVDPIELIIQPSRSFDILLEDLRARLPSDWGKPDAFPSTARAHRQVLFTFLDRRKEPAGSFKGEPPRFSLPEDVPGCELFLLVEATPQQTLVGGLAYDAALYSEGRIGRMIDHFVEALHAVAVDSELPVERLCFLPSRERREQLELWNATGTPFPEILSLPQIFAAHALEHPDACAVTHRGVDTSYAELDGRSNKLAHFLIAHGVKPDTAVAVQLDRSLDVAVAILGILKAGGCYVPLDPNYPAERRAFMLADAKAHLLLTHEALEKVLPGWSGTTLCMDRDWARINSFSESPVAVADLRDKLAYLIYTSGSTGKPKGVAMHHAPLINLILWQTTLDRFRPRQRCLQFSSLSFDVSFQELFSTWASGGTLVLVDEQIRRDPSALLQHIVRERVNRIFLPYVALRTLAEVATVKNVFPTELREVITAGEQLRVDGTLRQFFQRISGAYLDNQYGPSETHVVSSYLLRGDPATWENLPPIGRPVANTALYILDAHMQLLPLGVVGELYIGGAALARGYLGRPDVTAQRFVANPFGGAGSRLYRTGDLARFRADGVIQFLGRADGQVKIRGMRIELAEVASVASEIDGVIQCVATVQTLPEGGARLLAYLTVRNRANFNPEQVRRHLQSRLPAHMVPAAFITVDAFPTTPSGKIDVRALPPPTQEQLGGSHAYRAPRTPVELALAKIWCRLLGLDRVGLDDDFFMLGGDSLLAAELFLHIQKDLGQDLPLSTLVQAPKLESLAARLVARDVDRAWTSLVPLRSAGRRKPFFCIHGGLGNVLVFTAIAQNLDADRPFYGLQWNGLDGKRGATSIETMAAAYLREIRSVQPKGPYLLGGFCAGGLIALEIAQMLRVDGEAVDLVVLFDTPNLHSPCFKPRPLPLRLLDAACEKARFGSRMIGVLSRHFLERARRPSVRSIPHATPPVHGCAPASIAGTSPQGPAAPGKGSEAQSMLASLRGFFRKNFWVPSVVKLCHVTHIRVPPAFREWHAYTSIRDAVLKYRLAPYHGRVLYLSTGETLGFKLGLHGRWTDRMMGWSTRLSPSFTNQAIPCFHHEIMACPVTAQALRQALQTVEERPTEKPEGVRAA